MPEILIFPRYSLSSSMFYTKADKNTDITMDATKRMAITAAKVFLFLGLLKLNISLTSTPYHSTLLGNCETT